jgi:folate-binding protein YgfZ
MNMITNDWHQSKGAIFEGFFGIQIPYNYGNVEEEYWALRKNVALRDVSFFGKVKASGKDAQDFLHRMISNDVKSLAPGKGVWALFLDIKGHIQGDMKIYRLPDYLLMVMQHHALDRVMKGLDRYIIGEQLQLADVSNQFGMFQILGPQATAFLQSKGASPLPETELAFQSVALDGIETQVIRLGLGYALLVDSNSAVQLLNFLNLQPVGMEAFNIFRIESGLPVLGLDYDETNLPQESRLDHALNFNKGCYLGQEVMARLDAQGHVNKRLMGLVSTDEVSRDQKLFVGEKEAGRITSAARSPLSGEYVALGYVRREFANENQALQVSGNSTTAIVRNLPIVQQQ